ncbi:hypothetical protein Tco_1430022 [Tanacetum coccineum]
MTHPSPKRNMVPKAVLMRSGLVSLTTARPVNTAQPRTIVNSARPMTNVFNKAHSTIRRPINNKTTTKNSNFNQKVNTARPKAVLNAVKGNQGNPQQDLQEKGVIDSGCSRHMTGNMSYLTDFEEIDEGYVAFGDQRVKVIRCDNGTEFKNKEMNQFCERKGKFDGKADEGFFVGYSINSKAFRVFNSITRIVEENLHVQFSEDTPNITGSRPNWLFDIDALTKSMNYKPVVAGNRSNGNACTKACDDVGKARMETVPGKYYILLPLWTDDLPFSQNSKSSLDAGFKPSGDDEKKVDEDPIKDSESIDQKKDDNVKSTNNVNVASTNKVNVVGGKTSIKLPDDPNMPALEDIAYSDDDEDVGAEADMNNLSPIPTTRIHKDYPVVQIIRDLHSVPQTRRMTKNLEEHDEYIGCSTKKSLCTEFEKMMHKKFQMKSMGELIFFLGPTNDYAGASLDRKSTIGGCQFLGCILISWQCQKQTWFVNVTTKLNTLKITKHNLIIHSQNSTSMMALKFADSHNMVEFLEKPTESSGFKEIFWSTAKTKTINRETHIHALVDGKKIDITESSMRKDLQFADEDGIDCLPNTTIFDNLKLMKYENLSDKLTFYKSFFSRQWKFLVHTILQCLSPKKTAWNEFSSNIASAIICLATNQKFNFSKMVFDGDLKVCHPPNAIFSSPVTLRRLFANMKRTGKIVRKSTTFVRHNAIQNHVDVGERSARNDVPPMKQFLVIRRTASQNYMAEKEINVAEKEVSTADPVTTVNVKVTTTSATTITSDDLTLAQNT